jgi:hypothetical protein
MPSRSVLLTVLALGATALAGAPALAAAPAHTVTSVVRPITAANHLAPGFSATTEHRGFVDCTPAEASPVAVDGDILACSPSSEYAVACWRAQLPGWVRCLRDPFGAKVVRIRASVPKAKVAVPTGAAPFGLRLGDGERCTIRDGGAFGAPAHHPHWDAFYSCTGGGAVWAPASRAATNGIDQAQPLWTVVVGTTTGPLHTRTVVGAVFVGTKA